MLFWCDGCNVPLLSERCGLCGENGRKARIPAPVQECRPAGEGDLDTIASLLPEGCGNFLHDRMVLLCKMPGEDRRDFLLVDGHPFGTLEYDVELRAYVLHLTGVGAHMLRASGAEVRPLRGVKGRHVKGKRVPCERGGIYDVDGCTAYLEERGDGWCRVRDVFCGSLDVSPKPSSWERAARANEAVIRELERAAIEEIRRHAGARNIVAFSGGKDSLAVLRLAMKSGIPFTALYVDTGIEYPETRRYVREMAGRMGFQLNVAQSTADFFRLSARLGPPAKDYRWCCKALKAAPAASFLKRGDVLIEGRRWNESFDRESVKEAEGHPIIPGVRVLNPIRSWSSLQVHLYLTLEGLPLNPLYARGLERVGCYLCPAARLADWDVARRLHPELTGRWRELLREYAERCGLDHINHDMLWRWKAYPPKIRRKFGVSERGDRALRIAWRGGRLVGEFRNLRHASALFQIRTGRALPRDLRVSARERVLAARSVARSTLCTSCGLCAHVCPTGATRLTSEGVRVDLSLCTQCGACLRVCPTDVHFWKMVALE